jgi:two-component system sensor histidine kinase DctS
VRALAAGLKRLHALRWAYWQVGKRRSFLWLLLLVLVLCLLATLVWLSGRYEASQVQAQLEHDASEAATDIRSALSRNIQSLHAVDLAERDWLPPATNLLREHREIMRLEWRDPGLEVLAFADTPYRNAVFQRLGRSSAQADVALACSAARRLSGPAYSVSYFMPQSDGMGFEMLDMCLPILRGGLLVGYSVATYSLQGMLAELVGKQLIRGQSLSFTEADGTRLALYGLPMPGRQIYVAQQLVDLPGNTLVLRFESRKSRPAFFPNVLTALVGTMTLALLAVLFLLARDMRKRLEVEHDLGEALAFRKAMEDSLLTGLRARDLRGRITYVNPAFCKMVGLPAAELLNQSLPSPYWPPEMTEVYQQRQAIRFAGDTAPLEGYESIFMRADGTRFPVLIMEAPLINEVGKHTGWMSAILDVSEQRRVEELSRTSQDRLQATARLAMVGEMASLLSHELNQPLAAISSYATGSLNLIKHHAQSADAGAEDAQLLATDLQLAMGRIAQQAERAGKVIRGVHDFVRRRDQSREAVEPRALLDAVMPLIGLQARKLSVRVVLQLDPACQAVLCDTTMVEQVLLNLSRNGMQAMQGLAVGVPRLLTLRVQPVFSSDSGAWLEFAVIDQGVGIPAEVAAQLFTPFYTTRVEGMGLGLSLCRTVIEQHGGVLTFEAGLPRGTVFSFTLPLAGLNFQRRIS